MEINCVNPNSKEFKELLETTNMNSLLLEMTISQWQTENGIENFPTKEEINKIEVGYDLKLARVYSKESNYAKAKEYFDLYLNSELIIFTNSNFIIDEYIFVMCKLFNLNITESNPIFIKFDDVKYTIKSKKENNESLSKYEDNISKLIIYKTFFKIHWGNYSENEVSEILKINYKYILWCIINLDHFSIDNSIFALKNIRNDAQYIRALEINLIKQLIIEKWKIIKEEEDDGYSDYSENDDGPGSYGYESWEDMAFNVAFEGDIDAWNHYNQ